MSCRLCGENIRSEGVRKPWESPHNQSKHSEYANWYKKWVTMFTVMAFVDIPILMAALLFTFLYWTPGRVDVLRTFAIAIGCLTPAYVLMIRYFQKTSFFRRQWKEEHPLPSLS